MRCGSMGVGLWGLERKGGCGDIGGSSAVVWGDYIYDGSGSEFQGITE